MESFDNTSEYRERLQTALDRATTFENLLADKALTLRLTEAKLQERDAEILRWKAYAENLEMATVNLISSYIHVGGNERSEFVTAARKAMYYVVVPKAPPEPEAEDEWHCPHCQSDKGTWFDRQMDEHGNMANRCEACGKDVATKPETP